MSCSLWPWFLHSRCRVWPCSVMLGDGDRMVENRFSLVSVCLSLTFSDVCGHIPHCATLVKSVGNVIRVSGLRLQDARGSGFHVCQKRGLDPPSHHRNYVCVCAPSQQAFVVVTRCPLRIGKSCDVRGSGWIVSWPVFHRSWKHCQFCGTMHIAVALVGQKLSNERVLLQEMPLLRESDTTTRDQHSPHH